MTNIVTFRRIVEDVEKMGFNPCKLNFVLAIHVLKSISLIKNNNNSLINMLVSLEKCFLKKFVNCHKEEAPKLLKLYKEKLAHAKQLRFEKALSASNYVKFETPNKPYSVLAFLENHGFTKTQISNLLRKYPPLQLF
ncbi:hypothetical protein LOK49_LG08G00311 [Camellia lanceoleosa]|uniref:Uncharacterized protein n=1 Tax=Camellia lanceoleosa TaxID=1840588 RepID=A0ACC0GV37_9ERIC|nr:hypothetical protein LOK49_LG08G00311 [Camellia lanceoleosa]